MVNCVWRVVDADRGSIVGDIVTKQSVADFVRERETLAMDVMHSVDTGDLSAVGSGDHESVHPAREIDEVILISKIREDLLEVYRRRSNMAVLQELPRPLTGEAGAWAIIHGLCNATP
jgi:hypothetical protein